MKEMNLSQVRQVQVELLRHFSQVCEKHKLTWFLSNGTLLGAVKYKGFIPWDDDVDVCMPRKDYDRLLQLYEGTEAYRLMSFDEDYRFHFEKLADMRTKLVEKNPLCREIGVNIDVFPLDNFGNSKEDAEVLFSKAEKLRRRLNWSKLSCYTSATWMKAVAKWLYALPYKVFGPAYFAGKIMALAADTENGSAYMGNLIWGFYGAGEAHLAEVFAESTPVLFEGEQYPAPVGYDSYLRGLYGDYEKDPPKEKQVTHHCYEAYFR